MASHNRVNHVITLHRPSVLTGINLQLQPIRNAFAAAGGIIVVYRGMLEFIDGMARKGEVKDREGAVATVSADLLLGALNCTFVVACPITSTIIELRPCPLPLPAIRWFQPLSYLLQVLAHEIGHVVARHNAEKISTMPISFTLRMILAPVMWAMIPLAVEWSVAK